MLTFCLQSARVSLLTQSENLRLLLASAKLLCLEALLYPSLTCAVASPWPWRGLHLQHSCFSAFQVSDIHVSSLGRAVTPVTQTALGVRTLVRIPSCGCSSTPCYLFSVTTAHRPYTLLLVLYLSPLFSGLIGPSHAFIVLDARHAAQTNLLVQTSLL